MENPKRALIYRIYCTDPTDTSVFYNGTIEKYISHKLGKYKRAYQKYLDKPNIRLWSPPFYFFENYKMEQIVAEVVEECYVHNNKELKTRINHFVNQLPEKDQINRSFSKKTMIDYINRSKK